MTKLKVTLISFNWSSHFSLANGYLKVYAEKDSLIKDNADIQIVDFDAEHHNVRQALCYLSKEQPDVVAFSCYCWNMDKVQDLSRWLKQLYPKMKIVLGGPEVGPVSENCLAEYPGADIVVRGEGEETFQELLRFFIEQKGSLSSIRGISYRKNGHILSTGDRPLIKDLAEIPSPYLTGALTPRDGVTYIETYRGCPYKCAFCFEGKNFSNLRFFPEDRIKKEIELITSNPAIRSFHVVDSVFNLKKARLKRISRIFHDANRSGAGLKPVEVMAESLDDEAIELLKDARVLVKC